MMFLDPDDTISWTDLLEEEKQHISILCILNGHRTIGYSRFFIIGHRSIWLNIQDRGCLQRMEMFDML